MCPRQAPFGLAPRAAGAAATVARLQDGTRLCSKLNGIYINCSLSLALALSLSLSLSLDLFFFPLSLSLSLYLYIYPSIYL